MVILSVIAGIIILLICLVLIAALFIKKEYNIRRSIIIARPVSDVFGYVKFQRNQEHYSKWVMTDQNAIKEYRGKDAEPGFTSFWDSENKNVGKGEQEIKQIIDNERIDHEIRFEKPFKNVARVYMETSAAGTGRTEVVWGMIGNNPYPMNIMNLFIPEMLGKDLDISLANLKTVMEK